MTSKTYRFRLFFMILLLVITGLVVWNRESISPSQPLPPSTEAVIPNQESWLILPEMPATATQADVGAEIYRLVCQDCHGNRGQGLTDEWRAQWHPEDQNCWQSKCHASNHPPEGFLLPRYIPPLIGPGTLTRFETVLNLHSYMRNAMPWHNPGSLTETEYWQLTAYLARERQLDLGDLPLDEDRAAQQLLFP